MSAADFGPDRYKLVEMLSWQREIIESRMGLWACVIANTYLVGGTPSGVVVGEYTEAREKYERICKRLCAIFKMSEAA